MMINYLYHHRTAAFWRIRYNTLTNETLFSFTTTFITCIYTRVIIIVNNRRFVLGDDVLLLVQSDRVLFRTSGDIFHVLGIAGVRSKIEEKWREGDGD